MKTQPSQTTDTAQDFPPFLAFHGSAEIKGFYLERVRWHRSQDEIIQGTGWAMQMDGKFRGCAIGCTLENYDHQQYEHELGVPVVLARLQDRIFERLQTEDAKAFPEQFLMATPAGADLTMVWPRLALWILEDENYGIIRHVKDARFEKQRAAIVAVADLYREWIAGRKPGSAKWAQARSAAYAAAAAAAAYDYAAAAAAAAYDYAAAAYADADYAAAYAYAYADADAGSRKAFWLALRDRILIDLASSPVLAIAR